MSDNRMLIMTELRKRKKNMRKEKMEEAIAIRGLGDKWTIRAVTAQVRPHVTETWVDRVGIWPVFRLVQP